MAEEETESAQIQDSDKSAVKSSLIKKGKKSIAYLQKKKDNGEKIVQYCPGHLDPYWTPWRGGLSPLAPTICSIALRSGQLRGCVEVPTSLHLSSPQAHGVIGQLVLHPQLPGSRGRRR